MDILVYIAISVMNILCFFVGAKVGQKVVRNEPLEIKTPIQAYKDYQEEKEIDELEHRFKTIADNIDNYNGTSLGQKEL